MLIQVKKDVVELAKSQSSGKSLRLWAKLGIRNISRALTALKNWALGTSSNATENHTVNPTTTTSSVQDVPIVTDPFWTYVFTVAIVSVLDKFLFFRNA